jgi:DNA-binding helix-hairpin-helix protein with protein kinase domain
MSFPEIYLSGKRAEIARLIGKGGEGEVYLLAADPKQAVKVYTAAGNVQREAKVKAMIRLGLATSSNLVAYPKEIVTRKTGEFVGFTMRFVEGLQPIHNLYGPRSRKINFPSANFRFLVRAAANTARAVAQVHSSGACIIGDLNQSGILVARDATVALIDADSFQFQADSHTFPCLVGVPEFTPPELQGRSLDNVIRTKAHDAFGLSVAIFMLLFMGRHPYAGFQSNGDLGLDQLIARNLFAYTRLRKVGTTIPGVVATLDDYPESIGDAFERAFGAEPVRRPAASQWVQMLQDLEKQLQNCLYGHLYPIAAKVCPWCRMEASSQVVLFLAQSLASTSNTVFNSLDVDKILSVIQSIAIPEPQSITPKLPALPTLPTPHVAAFKRKRTKRLKISSAVAVATLLLWVSYPGSPFLWLVALLGAVFYSDWWTLDAQEWKKKYTEADKRWAMALARWHQGLPKVQVKATKQELEGAIARYKNLATEKSKTLNHLKAERRQRQLHDYLDRFLIRDADIPRIGPAKTATLAAFGIESAADLNTRSIVAIPGFGPGTARLLLQWRATHERHFVYNPKPTQLDLAAQRRVETEYAVKERELAQKISSGQSHLMLLTATLKRGLETEDNDLIDAAIQRAQIKADLVCLGVAVPPQSVP